MRIGIVKEIKDGERRVGLTPAGAAALRDGGHDVAIERGAGAGCGFEDRAYAQCGARLVDADEAWRAEMVIKVKEPLESEFARLRGQILFTFLHLAGADRALTQALLDSRTTAVAYETVEDADGHLPLLAPMSAVAGSMAPLVGARYLAAVEGGRGTLLAEVGGRRHGKVVIVGDGVVGRHAARVAAGIGANVVMFGLHAAGAPASLTAAVGASVDYRFSTPEAIQAELGDADLLVGAVLIEGARAPHVATAEMVERMPKGAVVVDVSIDQGGCVATSRPTTHSSPVYVERGVTHYCVANMPGAYPRTSTLTLVEATLPYIRMIADRGMAAIRGDAGLAEGVNTCGGYLTCRPVAEAFDWLDRYRPFADVAAAG